VSACLEVGSGFLELFRKISVPEDPLLLKSTAILFSSVKIDIGLDHVEGNLCFFYYFYCVTPGIFKNFTPSFMLEGNISAPLFSQTDNFHSKDLINP